MRRLTTREIVLLAIVIVAGIGYLWYRSSRAISERSAEFANAGAGERLADSAPRVPMDLLAQAVEGYDRNGRDLFKYSKRPPTAAELEAERLRREAELARQRAEQEAARERNRQAAEDRQRQQRTVKEPPRPETKQPPRIPFKYIGYLGPKDDRIAVFQDGETLLLAQKGELLQESFKVVEIRYESVVMGYTDPEFEARTRELPMMSQ